MAKVDDQTCLEVIKDTFDTLAKGANLLLVANAAGLAGCLSTLKDYNSTPMLKGIGLLIFLFGTGLMFATSGYIAMAFSRIDQTNKIVGKTMLPILGGFFWWTLWGFQFASLVSLSAAVWFCIGQFWRL
jgi:hypothetical protein